MSDKLHKDQQRVQNTVLPLLMALANEAGDGVAERSCTLINRLMTQGPDPLYLMETCPDEFAALCRALDLSLESGRDAIESAHWKGPGCLLEGQGLPERSQSYIDVPEAWRREALWLILAGRSDCTEEGYQDSVTVAERLQRANRAVGKLSRFALAAGAGRDRDLFDVMSEAESALRNFEVLTQHTLDERGFPHSEGDHAFYVLYKRGFQCVAVETPSLTFWGTTPDTSLSEQGVEVNKEISPQFGLVFK